MRLNDHDLHEMFKDGHQHSTGAAIRAIYERGIADGQQEIFDEIAGCGPDTDFGTVGLGKLDVQDHMYNLFAAAHSADQLA